MLKKGIRDHVFGNRLTLEQKFAVGKKAGFQGMEITLPEEGEYSLTSPDAKLAELGEFSRKHGLALHAMGGGAPGKYPLTAPDKATRDQGLKHFERSIDIAASLGVDSLLTITARVTPEVSYQDAWERSQAALKRLVPRAKDKGVHLLIENVWNNFLLSPLEMARFIDEAESDYVGSYFDCANCMAFGYPQHWISVLGKRIRRVHIKNFIAARKNFDGFCGLLEGDVDWKVVMPALKQIGYDAWATVEVEAHPAYYPVYHEEGVAKLGRQLDVILAEYK